MALGVITMAGLWYPPSTTGDALGIRRFRTPEIAGNLRIAQQFVMHEQLLTGVEIRPAAVGPISGALRLTLTDVTTGQRLRSSDVLAGDLVREDRFMFSVDEVDASKGHRFELGIASSSEHPATGIAFWATKGERLEDAVLLINGKERWADLAFRTRAARSSVAETLMYAPSERTPAHVVAVAALMAVWVLVGIVLRAVTQMPEDPL
jgi:hypothetical protein